MKNFYLCINRAKRIIVISSLFFCTTGYAQESMMMPEFTDPVMPEFTTPKKSIPGFGVSSNQQATTAFTQEELSKMLLKLPVSVAVPGLPAQTNGEISLIARDTEKTINLIQQDVISKEEKLKLQTEEKLHSIQQTV
ncbi:MAG: hypothetical protein V1855_02415, partial [bacterium]